LSMENKSRDGREGLVASAPDRQAPRVIEHEAGSSRYGYWESALGYDSAPSSSRDLPIEILGVRMFAAPAKNWSGEYSRAGTRAEGSISYYDLAGFCAGLCRWNRGGVQDLMVRPDLRRQGIGGRLLREAIAAGARRQIGSTTITREAVGICRKEGIGL